MNKITVTGMVLTSTPIGEYDKRVVILTRERGKISAFAKGARRPQSPLTGAVMPFSFGQFTLYEGRTSYTVESASISNYFAEITKDMEATCYGCYFMDIAAYYGKEGNNETALLKLLYQTLRALGSSAIPNLLIRYIFELKTLCIEGEGPQVFQCLRCGDKERKKVFSVKQGGLICSECMQGVLDGMVLEPDTIYTMQYIVSTPIEKLYSFRVSEQILKELGIVMERYMDTYVDRKFKSLDILRQIGFFT